MSNITGTIRAKATVEAGASPTIYNVTCTLAATEYSQALPTSVKKLSIRCRDVATLKIAFQSGETTVSWFTIPRGCSFSEDGINFGGTVYFQSDKPGVIVEILSWV